MPETLFGIMPAISAQFLCLREFRATVNLRTSENRAEAVAGNGLAHVASSVGGLVISRLLLDAVLSGWMFYAACKSRTPRHLIRRLRLDVGGLDRDPLERRSDWAQWRFSDGFLNARSSE